MDQELAGRITSRLREELLAPRINEFLGRLGGLESEPLEAFHSEVTPLVQGARLEFREILEMPAPQPLPAELNRIFYAWTVYEFNLVLPDNFPYILAMANIALESRCCIVCLMRQAVSDRHPGFSPAAIPIVFAESVEALSAGVITDMHLVDHPDGTQIVD